eukprot:g29511.t1
MAAFASDRFRTENVAVLLIVHALGRSNVFDRIGDWLSGRLTRPLWQIMTLCCAGACLSSVMNNIAAFTLMLPACFSVMAKGRVPARWIFLPLSYATLLGGLWTSIGTPANLLASALLQQSGEEGFAFLDFAPTGLAVTAAGLLVIGLWLPHTLLREGAEHPAEDDTTMLRVMTELKPSTAGDAPSTVACLEELLVGKVYNIIREERRVFPLTRETKLLAADRLLVEAEPLALSAGLLAGRISHWRRGGSGERRRVRAVVMPHSLLAGSSMAAQDLEGSDVEILQVEGEPARFDGPFEELSFPVGSILLLEGDEAALRSFIAYNDLVEVADHASAGETKTGGAPLLVFAAGVMTTASGVMAPEIALAGVVAVLCLIGGLDLRSALRNLNWSIIVILAAMLPLGEAVATTGAAGAIATAMTSHLPFSMALLSVFAMLALSMAITPFVNNPTTVAILAPIATELAHATHLSPQMLVMAVAVGASCDFLTPFGHHNNTLAYGLGQYRFKDFLVVGWPVSLAVFLAAGVVLMLVW